MYHRTKEDAICQFKRTEVCFLSKKSGTSRKLPLQLQQKCLDRQSKYTFSVSPAPLPLNVKIELPVLLI